MPLISMAKTPCYWILGEKHCRDSGNVIALSFHGYFMRLHKNMQGCSLPATPIVDTEVPNPKLKLLDQIREVMRLKHCALRTERTYADWVRRDVHFHQMQTREEMLPAEPKIEAFLSDLAVNGNVAVSTQNQASNGEDNQTNIQH
jgi:Phage integrase, N-terminal SAM-like domain